MKADPENTLDQDLDPDTLISSIYFLKIDLSTMITTWNAQNSYYLNVFTIKAL